MLAGLDLNILLAEDNPINRKIALIALKKLGLKADTAENGQEVLVAMEEHHYDLVLMDIQMPEMDGIEATKNIRKRWSRGPKIIVITSIEAEMCRDLCYDAGADDYLNKPVKTDELGAAIERNMCDIGLHSAANAQALYV
ncbi:MAG: hybrid sensory kinase in two-component regulatory system with RcsB and YojN [Methanosaeta sp. PtaU1.Bin112]|nr:MAG: hybrid sensory kinase in two-component regulatory system with RcsB and YojN [Methanosaeta sp. PtaU1.Bin112]